MSAVALNDKNIALKRKLKSSEKPEFTMSVNPDFAILNGILWATLQTILQQENLMEQNLGKIFLKNVKSLKIFFAIDSVVNYKLVTNAIILIYV